MQSMWTFEKGKSGNRSLQSGHDQTFFLSGFEILQRGCVDDSASGCGCFDLVYDVVNKTTSCVAITDVKLASKNKLCQYDKIHRKTIIPDMEELLRFPVSSEESELLLILTLGSESANEVSVVNKGNIDKLSSFYIK